MTTTTNTTKTNGSVPVKSIQITYKEGSIALADYIEAAKPSFLTFAAINAQLTAWAYDAPKGGGYDKTYFLVTWEDGSTYEGRFDLKHADNPQETYSGRVDVGESMRNTYEFLANAATLPADVKKRRDSMAAHIDADDVLMAREALSTLSFAD